MAGSTVGGLEVARRHKVWKRALCGGTREAPGVQPGVGPAKGDFPGVPRQVQEQVSLVGWQAQDSGWALSRARRGAMLASLTFSHSPPGPPPPPQDDAEGNLGALWECHPFPTGPFHDSQMPRATQGL